MQNLNFKQAICCFATLMLANTNSYAMEEISQWKYITDEPSEKICLEWNTHIDGSTLFGETIAYILSDTKNVPPTNKDSQPTVSKNFSFTVAWALLEQHDLMIEVYNSTLAKLQFIKLPHPLCYNGVDKTPSDYHSGILALVYMVCYNGIDKTSSDYHSGILDISSDGSTKFIYDQSKTSGITTSVPERPRHRTMHYTRKAAGVAFDFTYYPSDDPDTKESYFWGFFNKWDSIKFSPLLSMEAGIIWDLKKVNSLRYPDVAIIPSELRHNLEAWEEKWAEREKSAQ